jgi:periplasmic protein TonB
MPRFDPPAKPADAPSVASALMRAPIQVGGAVQSAKIVKKVVPTYPPLAKQARISGTVRLMGVIAREGTIQNLQVLSGHPLLQKAAIEAVRQWVYQPTILDGQAVEVLAPIDVIFALSP